MGGESSVLTLCPPRVDTPLLEGPLQEGRGRFNAKDGFSEPLVLLVDDDDPVREVTQRLLERLGVAVLPASSAQRCLELLAAPRGPIKLALVDISLKDGNCETLLEEISTRYPDCLLVAMSGYDHSRMPRVSGRTVDFLPKPFNLKDLRTLVRRAGLAIRDVKGDFSF
ncbi:MAG: response regulator [Planctomycetota bacterium]